MKPSDCVFLLVGARKGIQPVKLCTGCPWSWKVMEFRKTIFQAWKVMENSKGHGK